VGLALLVVLDTLTPAERLAFVLHDVFAVPFERIAPILDRSPAAARQLASRAPGGRPRVVFGFTVADGRIVEITLLADPDRLGQPELTVLDD
jgi:Sigma-70, region 4